VGKRGDLGCDGGRAVIWYVVYHIPYDMISDSPIWYHMKYIFKAHNIK
jgi:hypothetical protein